MNKVFFLTAAFLFSMFANGQDEMPEVWSTKFDHKIEWHGCDDSGNMGYGMVASDKEISVYESETGKLTWTKSFKELAPRMRKVDDIILITSAKKIFLLDLKVGKEQVAVIDLVTGKLDWDSDRYKLKSSDMISYISEEKAFLFTFKDVNVLVEALTGEERWSTQKFKGKMGSYYYENGMLTTVNFVPEELLALVTGFKNQIAKINMKTGEIVWENTYVGRAEQKILTKEFMYDLNVVDDKVVLELDGLQMYDYKTGAQLWSAAFAYDRILRKPVNASKFGVYGGVARPVFTDSHVYVIDMSGKSKQYIKKYDKQTGKLVWTSEEISGGAKVMPNLYVVDDKVIVQIGGIVEIQGIFKESTTNSTGQSVRVEVAKVYDESVKPYGVQAFSDADGRLAWDSERFKKGITNMYRHGSDNMIVSSGKALYSMKIQDGEVNYEVDAKNGGVGKVVMILNNNDNVVTIGEKGVSTFNAETGALIASNKYKRASLREYTGNILILETPVQDIAAFDVADNCKYWKHNARKESTSSLTDDGTHVYVMEKKTVTKLKTKP